MASKRRFLVFMILITIPFMVFTQAQAQDQPEIGFWDFTKTTISNDAKHFINLGISFFQAPLYFDSQDWQNLAYIGAGTSVFFLIDPSINEFALRSHSRFNDKLFKIEDYLNSGKGYYAGTGIYLTGFILKEEKVRLAGLHAIETIFLARNITAFLKFAFGRRRPYAGKNHMNFKLFRGKEQKYRSLPSGHTTGAFAFATVMAMSVDNIYWKTGWYSSAALVGFARIYHNVHWISDTFLAGAISYSVASYVMNFKKRPEDKKSSLFFSIYPSFNGLRASIQF